MYAQIEKSKDNKSRAIANSVAQKKGNMKQSSSLFQNCDRIVQCQLTATQKGGKWTLTGRPEFRAFVKRKMVDNYNRTNGTSFDPNSISLTDEELDQCHKISWKDIREYIQSYLNDPNPSISFRNSIATDLYNGESNGESQNALAEVDKMIQEKVAGTLSEERVKEVCTLLNSATPNLRLDDSGINRKIRQHFDPHLVRSPGGTHFSASPHSKKLADSEMLSTGVKWSPGGTTGYSSSVGRFKQAELSPDTAKREAFQ